jgi:hypothetical protein
MRRRYRTCSSSGRGWCTELAPIKAGTLDEASWLEPGVEVWTSSAQPWSPHIEQVAHFERGIA